MTGKNETLPVPPSFWRVAGASLLGALDEVFSLEVESFFSGASGGSSGVGSSG